MLGPILVRREPVGVVGRASCRGTCRCSSPCSSWRRRWPPAARVVLKPAPETPLDAYLLAECLEAAGLPDGVVNIVMAGREVGEYLVTHPDIDKVSFTGQHRRRPAHRRPVRRAAPALHPRARRQVGGHHPRRRRPRRHHRRALRADVADEQRPGLRGPDPHPGLPAAATTRSSTRWSRPPRRHQGRRPARPRDRGRPARRRTPADPGRGLHRQGPGGGRQDRHRRRPPGRARQGLVRRADRVRRRRQQDDHRPGGDLRSGGGR